MEAVKKNNSVWTDMIRPVVVLVVICLVASALLGLVNAKTAPVIAANEMAALAESMRTALPAASSFEELEVSPELAAKGVTGFYKGDNDTGYVVVAANKGYGGDVVVTVGFDAAGTILDRFTGLSGNANDVTLRSGATYTSNAVRSSVNAAFEAVAAAIG